MHKQFLLVNPKGRDHSEDLSVDGKIILRWKIVDWLYLSQDRDQWRAVVNTVMNLQVS